MPLTITPFESMSSRDVAAVVRTPAHGRVGLGVSGQALIVTGWVTVGSAVATRISGSVPAAKTILSETLGFPFALAAVIAARRLPAAVSELLVTVNVENDDWACADGAASANAAAMAM